ncbi:MAG: glucose 1-dehydrogenase [Clostridiales bacterium]|nr:glucose 1-dehydrogenase [Clostridiales bacterium]
MDVRRLFSIEGKKGFITGGAQGIGECLARAFAGLGAEVGIADINMEKAKATAERIAAETGAKVRAYACDVTRAESAQRMVEMFAADFGGLDFAINNAGIFTGIPMLEIDQKAFESVIDVNLTGVFLTAQAAARQMVKQGHGGSIVSTASMSGHIVNVPQTIANYNASKAGVIHLTKSMAVELAPHRIRVNCISPGYMQTDLIAGMKDMLPVWLSKMPEGSRLGFPEDLIGAYVYFISDASQYATGADLVVDGGYTLI